MKAIITILCLIYGTNLMAEITVLETEQLYLEKRAALLTEKQGAVLAAVNEKEKKAVEKEFDRKFSAVKSSIIAQAGKGPEYKKTVSWIKAGNLKPEMPFDIIEYIEDPKHVFETYNTFSVPIHKRQIVSLTFSNFQQYRSGKIDQYTYKKEGEFGFRRKRPLKQGGIGSDVIKYNIYTHKFFKSKVSSDFMRLKKTKTGS